MDTLGFAVLLILMSYCSGDADPGDLLANESEDEEMMERSVPT